MNEEFKKVLDKHMQEVNESQGEAAIYIHQDEKDRTYTVMCGRSIDLMAMITKAIEDIPMENMTPLQRVGIIKQCLEIGNAGKEEKPKPSVMVDKTEFDKAVSFTMRGFTEKNGREALKYGMMYAKEIKKVLFGE